nr:MAG TPA: hypothetical protein [Caudoviricetes sp.]
MAVIGYLIFNQLKSIRIFGKRILIIQSSMK